MEQREIIDVTLLLKEKITFRRMLRDADAHLSKRQYLKYLMMQWRIFRFKFTLERI